jgi:hypothetical protein
VLSSTYIPGTSVRIQKAMSNASWISIENAAQASSHQNRCMRQRYDNLKVVKITARPANTVMMATLKYFVNGTILAHCDGSNAYLLILWDSAGRPLSLISEDELVFFH